MPTTKRKLTHLIQCVQKVGDTWYPRIFAYWTKAERKKNYDAIKRCEVYAEFYLYSITMDVPVPTRAERRRELAAPREQDAEERRRIRREQRERREAREREDDRLYWHTRNQEAANFRTLDYSIPIGAFRTVFRNNV